MSDAKKFSINLEEQFNDGKPLANAPVHEAVIHWRARSESQLVQQELLTRLTDQLPDYPAISPQHELEMKFSSGPEGAKHSQKAQWKGFRFESNDRLHVAQFDRNGFAFSRLKQYDDWTQFTGEAIRLWNIFVDIAEPIEIERLGIRFINMIEIHPPSESPNWLSDWLKNPPPSPSELNIPVQHFVHQTSYSIPDHPYALNVVQMIQPSGNSPSGLLNLILDLDVSTVQLPVESGDSEMMERLEDMRWIKNKAFQSYMTEAAIKRFQ